MISACMTVWNEEEIVHLPLAFLKSMPYITEVCIVVDEECTDETLGIVEDFDMGDKKKYVKVRYFDGFGKQMNAALEMATQEWTLWISGDETYTQSIQKLFADLPAMPAIRAVRVPTFMMISETTRQNEYDGDEHVRLWRTGLIRYRGELHELPLTEKGENMHILRDNTILDTYMHPVYKPIHMKHFTFLKSDDALREKARRWSKVTPTQWDEEYWVKAKYWAKQFEIPYESHIYEKTNY